MGAPVRRELILDDFAAAIENLYQVFSVYPLKDEMSHNRKSATLEKEMRLRQKPLRELSAEDLKSFATDALFTWGDRDDFKHFLPRLFECQALTGTGALSPEVLFGKLAYCNWRFWLDEEQEAVQVYFRKLWVFVLTSYAPDLWSASDNFLCGIAQAVDDLGTFLADWEQLNDRLAVENLAAFINQNAEPVLKSGGLFNGHWARREEQKSQVIAWLLDRNLVERLQAKPVTDDARQTHQRLLNELLKLQVRSKKKKIKI